jgi:hypothetical protein
MRCSSIYFQEIFVIFFEGFSETASYERALATGRRTKGVPAKIERPPVAM